MDDTRDIALRAESAAQDAHDRLNRMNGSIDRLGTNVGTLSNELGKQGTKIAIFAGFAVLISTCLSTIVAGIVVYYVTKGQSHT